MKKLIILISALYCHQNFYALRAKEDPAEPGTSAAAQRPPRRDPRRDSIYKAFAQKDWRTAKMLIEQSGDFNAPDRTKTTLLMKAILGNAPLDFIEWLLKNGADPNLQNLADETTLMLAVYRSIGYDREPKEGFDLVNKLLDYGADSSIVDNQDRIADDWIVKTHGLSAEEMDYRNRILTLLRQSREQLRHPIAPLKQTPAR